MTGTVIGGICGLGERQLAVGPLHEKQGVLIIEIVGVALQEMRCQAPRLGEDRFAGTIDGSTADGCGSRAPGAVAVRHPVRVALNDRDVLYGQAETVSCNLRKGDAVPLAMRMAAAQHRDLAVGMDTDGRRFKPAMQAASRRKLPAWTGSGLVQESSDADAHQLALLAQLGLLLA